MEFKSQDIFTWDAEGMKHLRGIRVMKLMKSYYQSYGNWVALSGVSRKYEIRQENLKLFNPNKIRGGAIFMPTERQRVNICQPSIRSALKFGSEQGIRGAGDRLSISSILMNIITSILDLYSDSRRYARKRCEIPWLDSPTFAITFLPIRTERHKATMHNATILCLTRRHNGT